MVPQNYYNQRYKYSLESLDYWKKAPVWTPKKLQRKQKAGLNI